MSSTTSTSFFNFKFWMGADLCFCIGAAALGVVLLCSCEVTMAQVVEEKEATEEIDVVATGLNPVAGRPIPKSAFHNATFTPDGKRLAVGRGTGEVLIWDLDKGQLKTRFQAHENWVFSIVFDHHGKQVITAGGDDLIKIWDVISFEKPTIVLTGHTGDVHSIVLTPDQMRLISAGDDMTPIVWDLETRKIQQRLLKHDRQIPALAMSPDGSLLATASRDSKLRIFQLSDAALLQTIERHEKDVISVRFSPDGTLVVAGDYAGNVGVWDADMGFARVFQKCGKGSIVCVDFSFDGESVVAIDDSHLYFLAPTDDQKPETVELERLENEQFSFVRFHPSENRVAITTTLCRILIYDRNTKKVSVLRLEDDKEADTKKKSENKSAKVAEPK
jgi:WD40 repeat protein